MAYLVDYRRSRAGQIGLQNDETRPSRKVHRINSRWFLCLVKEHFGGYRRDRFLPSGILYSQICLFMHSDLIPNFAVYSRSLASELRHPAKSTFEHILCLVFVEIPLLFSQFFVQVDLPSQWPTTNAETMPTGADGSDGTEV